MRDDVGLELWERERRRGGGKYPTLEGTTNFHFNAIIVTFVILLTHGKSCELLLRVAFNVSSYDVFNFLARLRRATL